MGAKRRTDASIVDRAAAENQGDASPHACRHGE
jgi:hypothetical protein